MTPQLISCREIEALENQAGGLKIPDKCWRIFRDDAATYILP